MSVEAITWALKERVTPSSMKFVLVVLANCANTDTCEAYPSAAYLVDATGQDRKTIQANIRRLIEMGYIIDTGDRRGRTNQVIVYRLNCPWYTPPEVAQKRATSKRPEIPAKEARFSPETGPKTGHGTQRKLKEPINTPLPPIGGQSAQVAIDADAESGTDTVDQEDLSAGFDEFWRTWPDNQNRQDRALCLARWRRKKLHRFTDVIVADVVARKETRKWRDGYIESPSKYLKGSRWMDSAGGGVQTSALCWDDSVAGVQAMAERLGLEPWDKARFERTHDQADMFHVYAKRVRDEYDRRNNGAN